MFINPRIAIENKWIVHPECNTIEDWEAKKLLSPNAIDFTLDKVYTVNTDQTPYVSENFKQMRSLYELHAETYAIGKRWLLEGGRVYDGMSQMYVEVPPDVAAILYTRSTFTRNGVFLTSGLYDSGFKGAIGFTVFTVGGGIQVDVGTRIGQIAFVQSASAKAYEGGWNHAQGSHWTTPEEQVKLQKAIDSVSKLEPDWADTNKGQAPVVASDDPVKPTEPQKPTLLEPLITSNPNMSDFAKTVEKSHKSDSGFDSKAAGKKNYI